MPGLDELGWLQFERLCELVLEAEAGVAPGRWEGSADRCRTVVCDEELRLDGRTLAPPVVACAAWREAPDELPPHRTLVTFAPRAGSGDVAYGEAELLDAIRRHPELRFKLPALLSLGAVEPDAEALARSTLDIEATRALARVFVATPAWHRAVATLRRHHFAVLTGPPEMGKTAIARTLGLALLTEGWEVHETLRPEEVERAYDRDRAQLFIADDAFGAAEYRPDAAERWAERLGRILRVTDERHWLIWTSRPAPLAEALRRGGPRPASVLVDAGALGVEEKTLILFRHARAAGLDPRQLAHLPATGRAIVDHPHFTPERIRRYVARGAPENGVERELAEPTAGMAASYRALRPEQRELLHAMLDSPPGSVAERDLAAALRRHAASGLPRAPADLVDGLADHFLRVIA
ncbi:MAG TPA: hypothetical protein VNS09_16715 [Solirubrobacter sp.]|nr:hypothetical protein [Solirubrobacter sp.]